MGEIMTSLRTSLFYGTLVRLMMQSSMTMGLIGFLRDLSKQLARCHRQHFAAPNKALYHIKALHHIKQCCNLFAVLFGA